MIRLFRIYRTHILLFIGALAVRLWRLGAQSLWLDEGGTWNEITTKSWGALLAELVNPRQGYPLYHVVMKAWIGVAGDSEVALRLPSAVAGALLVALTYELGRQLYDQRVGVAAAALLLLNPFGLWQAQDAKAYSLLMLVVVWSVLALLAALRHSTRTYWFQWVFSVIVLLLVHRFALFVVIGEVAMIGWFTKVPHRARWVARFAPLGLFIALVLGLIFGLKQDPNAPPIGATINPFKASAMLATRLLFDKAPEAVPTWVLLAVVVVVAGVAVLGVWRGSVLARRILLTVGGLPFVLYLLALAFNAPIFEPRYVGFALPLYAVWLAASVYALPRLGVGLAGLIIGLQVLMLVSKPYGLWSGNHVKEDYRGAIQTLAQKLTPDDVVALHPAYISTLYRYYAPRVSPDSLPPPVAFGRAGALGYSQGEFDNDYAALLANKKRAWLLIAPENAKAIDPPNPQFPQDDMGKVGINFLTADINEKWRCLDQPWLGFNGLRILCQSFPAPLQSNGLKLSGAWSIPPSASATWSNGLELLGYTVQPWATNEFRAGGTLPIQVFWRTTTPLDTDYRLFVHLVPTLGAPVAAQLDTAPLNGGVPTSRWQPNQTIHDELAVPLPAAIAAGRYLVVLGWYDPRIPDVETQRVTVTASTAPAHQTLIELGEIVIIGQ